MNPSVLGWNDSRGLLLSWDGTTPGESVMEERHQGSKSVLGWNDSSRDILSWDRTTPVGSFSACETTPGESFCPGIERPHGRYSVLGWNDSRGVILS